MCEGIYRIGANIKNGDLFEGMWPIPDGVSLNCYVVKGEKTALIDLVRDWGDAVTDLQKQMASIPLSFNEIDYLILNWVQIAEVSIGARLSGSPGEEVHPKNIWNSLRVRKWPREYLTASIFHGAGSAGRTLKKR